MATTSFGLAMVLVAAGWGVPPSPPALQRVAEGQDVRGPSLLAAERLEGLPAAERAVWAQYVEQSLRERERDHAVMAAELRATGKTQMTAAPYLKAFKVGPEMTPAWFKGPEARHAADNMVTYQTPSGGWSKRTDVTSRRREPGESYFSENTGWTYVPTFDNDSTTEQLKFLRAVNVAQPDALVHEAIVRGIQFVLRAQFPNGCWPQGYPLQGGYHDAATFNDNSMVNILRFLSAVAADTDAVQTPPALRARAAEAVQSGTSCLLKAQVLVKGVRTVWAQQHDPLTLAPTPARSYELRGLSGRESAAVVMFLMDVAPPTAPVVAAVDAAVEWFRHHQISGWRYDKFVLTAASDAPPIWPRLTEIETGRPIFSNRDGIKLYDWNQLTDRRDGYGWFGKEPAKVLDTYATWSATPAVRALRPKH